MENFRSGTVTWPRSLPSEKLPVTFLKSPEYLVLGTYQKMMKAFPKKAVLMKEGQDKTFNSIYECLEHIVSNSKRGQNIQRYKGLGEMNPKELFETTMNPESRRLLQIDVSDVSAAEEMFTKLMGDEVEPRRQFIQDNALNVRNLDV